MVLFTKASKWVVCDPAFSAPIVWKRFSVRSLASAVMDISGLGYYELFVNGVRVGDEYFKPAVSDYGARDFAAFLYPLPDKTSHSVYYNTYDLRPYLREGENVLAVMLGNGFYRQKRRLAEGDTSFGDALRLRYEVRLADGDGPRVIATDGTEGASDSFIRENNLFFGEVQDYTAIAPTDNMPSTLAPVTPITPPPARLRRQRCPNDRVREVIVPRVVSVGEESTIYDVGKNVTGFVVLRPRGAHVRIRHAEELRDGALDFSSTGGTAQISENIYQNAEGRLVHPWFSWSGFRYFEVFGDAEIAGVFYLAADVRVTSSFECGNAALNWLYDAFINGMLGNMHGGVPSDCPHRERLGYTGDGQLTAEGAMLMLDARTFYEKWMQDIADCQDTQTGHIQHTAPFLGGGGGPGGWGSAAVIVPYAHYKIFGEVAILRRYFGMMQDYLASMRGFLEDGLIVREREGGWCLGEWATAGKILLPPPFVNTYYYIRSMELAREIAALIGEGAAYGEEISAAKAALVRAYYDPATGDFCGGVQAANAFALTLSLGDERTRERLLAHYRAAGGFDTGIFGTDVLAEYLAREGECQLLFDLLTAEGDASFGFMRSHGATTLWEDWSDKRSRSHNHPMLGGCVRQIFYALLGISFVPGAREVTLAPPYIEGIGDVRATLTLPTGVLHLRYTYKDGVVHPTATVEGDIQLKIKR